MTPDLCGDLLGRPILIDDQDTASFRNAALVTGTPVGCALGEGEVDWERVFEVLEPLDREIFLSVECGRVDEAERSLEFLRKTLGDKLIE